MKTINASVLMPSYNCLHFLKESIDSILNQSFEDFEFIIVNDGSDDGSEKILAEYANKDKRINIINNNKNMGIVFSLNRGISECRGKYIIRMDADDIALVDRLKKQIFIMEKNPDILVLGAALSYIDAIGKELGIIRYSETGESLLLKNPMLHPTVVIRHSALMENQFSYQENYRYAEDYFLWLQLSRVGRLGAIEDVVLKYRLSRGASRVRHMKGMLRATLRVKLDGMRYLGIKPEASDIFRFFLETLLLLMPSSLVFLFYWKLTFGRGCEVKL